MAENTGLQRSCQPSVRPNSILAPVSLHPFVRQNYLFRSFTFALPFHNSLSLSRSNGDNQSREKPPFLLFYYPFPFFRPPLEMRLQINLNLFVITNIYVFSISPLNSFSSLVISHHPPFPYFLLSFIHEGTEVYPFYSIYRLGSAVLSSINSPPLSFPLWQISTASALRWTIERGEHYRFDYRRFTLGRQPHRRRLSSGSL